MTRASSPEPIRSAVLDAPAAAPGISHGFFTRAGGVSGGLYAGLNCGPGSADDPAAVGENRDRVRAHLGAADLVTAYQVHSPDVVVVRAPWDQADAPKCDGLVTTRPGLAIGVLTADCVPVLFADSGAGVIGAAHAGWKGAIGGVLETTVYAMTGAGAELSNIRAAIGPAICQESYEVGPEFRDRFLSESQGNDAFFRASDRDGHFLFDLAGYVQMVLDGLGLGAVDRLDHDTRTDQARFFSYRRATLAGEDDYGRQISAIALKGD